MQFKVNRKCQIQNKRSKILKKFIKEIWKIQNFNKQRIRRTEKSEQWKKLEKEQWINKYLEMNVNASGKVLKLMQID